MASPMVEGRVDPHKKAHFTLHISDAIADGEVGDYTSVKYNHKPAQTTSKRSTTLTATSTNGYRLTLEDEKAGDNKDVFVFTGQKTVPKKSYILLFDTTSQKATLEPLSSAYTFNIASKNGSDISSTHSKIYPRKQKDAPDDPAADDLFGGDVDDNGDGDPDSNNPFDFRHFMNGETTKNGNDSEYAFVSSPDYRTGTGSAMNTPQVAARKPAAASSRPKATPQAAAKPKKRKSPEPERAAPKKTAPKKQAAPPTVRLERRATDNKPARKSAAPPSSKIKSAEIVHSSDESDEDGEPDNASSPPAQRSPSPPHRDASPESDEDEDEDMEEFAIGESQPSQVRTGALASLGLGQSIGQGYHNSPGGGPISLASAASSVQGSPDPHDFTSHKSRSRQQVDDEVIDFGDLGGPAGSDDEDAEDDGMHDVEEDRDVESIHLGSPAQQASHDGGMSLNADADGDAEEEEEDPLLKEMMEGLAGGDSSEESEEE
ncbi:hypothetical protein DPSP01_007519 [Paraphaeosphaeria sporulosa]|uniref:Transcription elongation factor Eaf N-terminal domain-containing protein n=1 Tax=Paraphaeosphaeria sporulosa TaxID=1460663 RepID=A0A177CXI7_9PLEO|nr:uncharacterized protein CC84DRAFT_1192102 [Paraphaeosphaeria sporulosa]OAG11612.1 hypothetical protein CC84DRAFT_1192102 [Paraphaeosphaeria sporulosa]